MRIVFVNPHEEPFVNMGLAYVISSVERSHRVRLLDMAFHRKNYPAYVLRQVREFKPDLVGFSTTSFNFGYATQIAAVIKEAYPDMPFVFGGVHPTLAPEETLRHPCVDAVCIGEGEDALLEYLAKLEQGQEPAGVAGIWYKDASGGIVKNALRPFREDLDTLPFPNWDHWEIERYLKTNETIMGGLRHLTARGCPYSCAFCSNPAIRKAVPGKFCRSRTPENVIAEIQQNRARYAKKGFRHVAFGDATFGMDAAQLERLCRLYVKEGLHRHMTWDCQTRADIVTEPWVRQVFKAGCSMVTLGIESGDDYIRTEVYRKEVTREHIFKAIRSLRACRVPYCVSIIVGCPFDTRETIANTVRLLREIRPLKAHITFYQNLPYTELSRRLDSAAVEGNGKVFKAWNAPRSGTLHLGRRWLKVIMLRFFIRRIAMLCAQGFGMRKGRFLVDVATYVLGLHNSRAVALTNYCFLMGLEQFTIYRYALEECSGRRLQEEASL